MATGSPLDIRFPSLWWAGQERCSGESSTGVSLSNRSCLQTPNRASKENRKNLHEQTVKLGGSHDVKQFSQQGVL
jgi:hypothetical protein